MFEIGECVIFLPDGSRGTVVEVQDRKYHIVWEDHFVSWEKEELLARANVHANLKPNVVNQSVKSGAKSGANSSAKSSVNSSVNKG